MSLAFAKFDSNLKINRFPTPAVGLALGVASSGKLLSLYNIDQQVTTVIAIFLVAFVVLKFLLTPSLLHQDLSHPVLGSILPTLAMTLMLLSDASQLGVIVWYVAVSLHVILLISFIYFQSKQFSLSKVLPSWFVPPVGLAVGAMTCPDQSSFFLAQCLLYFAIAMYFILLPIILYRLIFIPIALDAFKPTIAILAAPPNLCLAAYLTFIEQPSIILVSAFISLALLMTLLVYISLIALLRLPFSPAFASFTFPLVISATAMTKSVDFLKVTMAGDNSLGWLALVANIEMVIACAMVSYVFYRYLTFYAVFSLLIPPYFQQKMGLSSVKN